MNDIKILYLVYGMGIMFCGMMSWLFSRLPHTRLKNMISVLMLVLAFQYVFDVAFAVGGGLGTALFKGISAGADFLTVGIYGCIVFELCRPGWLSPRAMLGVVSPFVGCALAYGFTASAAVFAFSVLYSVLFGAFCTVWAFREFPVYHRRLKEEYSYDEDINLHWLRGVMALFVFILTMWVVSCYRNGVATKCAYMASALVGWMAVCYFIHRQQSVLNELRVKVSVPAVPDDAGEQPLPYAADDLGARLKALFVEERVYLDPKLRLSDLVRRIGTNRTYLSQYFNQQCSQSFYEYVNNFRLSHSESLLRDTDYTLDTVASMSGFNSLSTFRRAFSARYGCSPQEYRAGNRGAEQ